MFCIFFLWIILIIYIIFTIINIVTHFVTIPVTLLLDEETVLHLFFFANKPIQKEKQKQSGDQHMILKFAVQTGFCILQD